MFDQLLIMRSINSALLLSFGLFMISLAGFMVLEPTVSRSASASSTDIFIVRQQITGELSFLVPAADVTMVGSLNGITGGTATGSTYAVVRTNSPTGYVLDIKFSNTPAMRGETTGSTALYDYGGNLLAEPTFGFIASSAAQFAYTVNASNTSDIDASFLDDTIDCASGAGYTEGQCWMGPSTTDFRLIDRIDSAESGATTSIIFRVTVPSNPVPALVEDYYMATATLTATNQ